MRKLKTWAGVVAITLGISAVSFGQREEIKEAGKQTGKAAEKTKEGAEKWGKSKLQWSFL